MKTTSRVQILSALCCALALGLLFCADEARAVTSPYVTAQTDVPLNQATNDTVNGVLPFFVSHTTVEGTVDRIVDATSPTAPTQNVILGPDNTWIGVAWDFGDPPSGHYWRLDRFDAWISAGDNLRKGYRADISVSQTGGIDDFTVVTNSLHWEGLTQNAQFNHIRYDFPTTFIAGETNSMDRYPVEGFRYLRFNSRGDGIEGVDWQTRFVEIDIWVSAVPQLVIDSITHDGGGNVTLNWSAISGRTYHIEYKSDLNNVGWNFLDSVLADSDAGAYTDTSGLGAQRFYQLVLQP